MAKSSSESGPRWVATAPQEVLRPAGPESALIKALELLGPFTHARKEAAKEAGLVRDFKGQPTLICKRTAIDFIIRLVINLNYRVHLARGAPRLRHVLERLEQLETDARSLINRLHATDDLTRLLLVRGGIGSFSDRELRQRVPAGLLPRSPDATPDDDEEGSLARGLQDLVDLARTAGEQAVALFGTATQGDKGGRGNLYEKLHGDAKRLFVIDAFDVFEFFKPGKATSTLDSPFFCFVHSVYLYATGHAEEQAKVAHWLSALVGTCRRIARINAQIVVITDQMRFCPKRDQFRVGNLIAEKFQLEVQRHREEERLMPHLFIQTEVNLGQK